MERIFIEDHIFQGISFIEEPLAKGEYENCTFTNCIFANTHLSIMNFVDCTFSHCDFSLAKVSNTAFKDL